MSFLIKMISLFVWMVAVPVCMGFLPGALLPREKRTIPVICLAGYCTTFALFTLVYLPVLLLTEQGSFTVLVVLFTIVSLLAAAGGMVMSGGPGGLFVELRKPGKEEALLWGIFACLLLFQLYMAYTHSFYDGDDSFYVVESVLADQKDSMYRILPYTGGATSLDVRHALAGFPMWIAYLARMSGTHAAIVTHAMLPLLLIPLTDLAIFVVGENLFDHSKKEMFPAFMILVALIQIFGNVSIYTQETFLLTRTWQGKSIFANFVAPVAFMLLTWIARAYRDETTKQEKYCLWIWVVMLNLMAGLCTSMSVVLLSFLLVVSAFWISLAEKNFRILRNTILACIPNGLQLLLFVCLTRI